jgi:hypothetical protein
MGSAENIFLTLRDRGHQRLLLVVSIAWVLVAGWLFWRPFAQYQPVDASRQFSDWCEAEESAELYAAGEKAYQTCLEERRKIPNTHARQFQGSLRRPYVTFKGRSPQVRETRLTQLSRNALMIITVPQRNGCSPRPSCSRSVTYQRLDRMERDRVFAASNSTARHHVASLLCIGDLEVDRGRL